jgi:DNA gyrase/topoisomerase IV subunit A
MTVNSVDAIEKISDNFMEYAIDTNNNKTFPDVRDGLKPGARACLWEMYKRGYLSNKPHVKCAKVSGGVIASTWPHSGDAVYETFVRMSQDFTENTPEVEFHGNNGNVVLGGDSFANSRYTECRLSSMAEEFMFNGVDSNAVNMIWNFSEDEQWPSVLPSVFPRLLVNGTQGIGVSISSFMCGHNLSETVDLIVDYIKTDKYDDSDYMPDFPTGGTLVNPQDVPKINSTGKGKIIVEAKYAIDKKTISFTELPFQVYLEPVIEEIKKALDNGSLQGIKSVVNASDKNGMCLEVECRPDADPEETVSRLMASTSLRKQYNVIQRAIVSKTPELLTTKKVVDVYIEHNLECIRRVAEHTKSQLTERIEVLQGFIKAVASIDDVVSIIKNSKDQKDAKVRLVSQFDFTDRQAKAILDMRLAKLSSLETIAVEDELSEKTGKLEKIEKLLSSEKEQKRELVSKLKTLKKKYGTDRKTVIQQKDAKEVSAVSSKKYNIEFDKGLMKKTVHFDGEFTDKDTLVLVGAFGDVYRVAVEDIPVTKPGVSYQTSLLMLDQKIVAMNPSNILIVTRDGKVKKINVMEEFAGNTRNKTGLKSIKLIGDDEVLFVFPNVSDTDYLKLVTNLGMSIKFCTSEVNPQKKTGSGVKGITLGYDDVVAFASIVDNNLDSQARGGKGRKNS